MKNFPIEKRMEMARRAFALRETGDTFLAISCKLDVSLHTAQNLVKIGQRIWEETTHES